MTVTETKLSGVYIVEPRVFGDSRGWFMETYSKIKAPEIECNFVQDNHSFSANKNTLRGIHFQKAPMEQAKLVRCSRGAILDVAVDLRPDSNTFGHYFSIELSADNKKQLFIPHGFGHGFITLTDDVEIIYKADNYYSPEHETGILWSDPDVGIDWGCGEPVLSDKDKVLPLLKELKF
ncbi:MAG: dTDP-4-dehydrorhamnose 3,5-epimerase [Oscillospiraceae bacterium]|nr:dTDP-4-dehydrorhamnose 3,5-epimerase [Oscillospiraceae bacterium]MCL2278581.1 dTDP-4-dehydrorhamnose 3,5-epimerase [Oscillospiraceae bacterium]